MTKRDIFVDNYRCAGTISYSKFPVFTMKQASLSDIEFASKKRLTRRERFLAEIEAAKPWAALFAAPLPHYPKGTVAVVYRLT
jgi:hypothetical protein